MPNAFVIVAVFAVILLALQCFLPLVYGPVISEHGLEIRLLSSLRLRVIPFTEIASASVEGWRAGFRLNAANWTNRPLWTRGCVVVRLRNSRGLLLSPNDPVQFARDLEKRLAPATTGPEAR